MAKISTIFVTSLRSVRNMAVARIGRFKLTGEGACGDCHRQDQKNYRKESSFFMVLPMTGTARSLPPFVLLHGLERI